MTAPVLPGDGDRMGGGLPHLLEACGKASPYELVSVASGVNSNFANLLEQAGIELDPPETMRTYICEFRSDPETIERVLGDSMHVFLLDIPRLEFAALIPKGEFVTMCLLGQDVDQELVNTFLRAPEVTRCFPVDSTPCVCTCAPLINVRGPRRPYADRLVLVGDSGVTRLYKDGIGAALRTAKAAAETAVLQGISSRRLRPLLRADLSGNRHGQRHRQVHVFGDTRIQVRALPAEPSPG